MTAPNPLPHPNAANTTDARPGAPSPPSIFSPSSAAPFYFPLIGDRVRFQRSPTHHPEIGIVRARAFGTRIIDIVDMGGKPLRLDPSQYEVVQEAKEMPHG